MLFVPCRSSIPSSDSEREELCPWGDIHCLAELIVVEQKFEMLMKCDHEMDEPLEVAQLIVAEAEAMLSSMQFRRNMLFK